MFTKIINHIKKLLHIFIGFLKRTQQPSKKTFLPHQVFCKNDSIKLVSSSSVVLHIETSEIDGYFFESRKHTNIKKYVNAFIEDYFLLYCNDYPEKESDKKFILNSIKNRKNFKKFISMGVKLYNVQSGCMTFLNTGDGTAIGLETRNADAELIKRLQKFVGQYAWCQLNSYNTNKSVRRNAFQVEEANAALATLEISKLLNLDYLIPQAHFMTLNIDNTKSLFGLFIKSADGTSILPYNSDERKAKITPSLQRDLSNLNILDVITHEQDHSPNNYNVIMDNNGLVTGIHAFDNKGNGTFFLRSTLDFQTFKNCSSFIRPDGTINRPYISNEVFTQLKQITPKKIYASLHKNLNLLQIFFCWKRVQVLIKSIEKTLSEKNDFSLLDKTQWSDETIKTELNGAYGKTYLISFYSDVFLY